MRRQKKRFEQCQIKIMEALMQKMCQFQQNPASGELQIKHSHSLINAVHEFHFHCVTGVTFDSWSKKYEGLLYIHLCRLDDAWKVKILLRKLGTTDIYFAEEPMEH